MGFKLVPFTETANEVLVSDTAAALTFTCIGTEETIFGNANS